MKIGIFDSGLGGLLILKAIRKALPQYDYIYLGDTKRLPYGNRSQESIFEFTKNGVEFLFSQNCSLVIIACNTASTEALRKIQRDLLPKKYPNKKVLGVIIPSVEAALEKPVKHVGILATTSTVNSNVYPKEFHKLNSKVKVYQQAAPLLVPLLEFNGVEWTEPILRKYLTNFSKDKLDTLILGCTHYGLVKKEVKAILGNKIKVLSQDEIIPKKLKIYLQNHPEIRHNLSVGGKLQLFVTDISVSYTMLTKKWFGKNAKLLLAKY